MLTIVIYAAFIGTLAAIPWGAAFGATITTSIKIGGLIGLTFGILIALYGKMATLGGKVQRTEAVFVNASILTMIGLLVIGAGVLAWLISWIFF